MKLTLQSTDRIVEVDGAPARVWTGTNEDGVPCVAFIRKVAIRRTADSRDFDAELREIAPTRSSEAIVADFLPPTEGISTKLFR